MFDTCARAAIPIKQAGHLAQEGDGCKKVVCACMRGGGNGVPQDFLSGQLGINLEWATAYFPITLD